MQITPTTNAVATTQDTTSDPSSSASSSSSTGQLMSESDFLNLLVTQMTSQDPLDPMTNEDLLGQMVQFSTLQSNATMDTDMGQMQSNQTLANADSLIGQQVNLQVDANGDTTQGLVTGVDVSSGTPEIVVNGQSYNLSQVLSVTPPPTSSSQPTN
jgi:flagellar basal-body rod modification protein FlgD